MGILKVLETIAAVGSTLDWITPAISLATTRREDRFAVDADSINEVEYKLRRAGIRVKNQKVVGDQLVFDVAKGKGDEAARILGLD